MDKGREWRKGAFLLIEKLFLACKRLFFNLGQHKEFAGVLLRIGCDAGTRDGMVIGV
jgi:hypothetical protein